MSKDITALLKEATKDILSDEILKEIESAFNESVKEKVQLHVEKALTEQDEDYSSKLNHLLEAIDADHTVKLKRVVEAIDANHVAKLKAIVEKYQTIINSDAKKFKADTINNISSYLDAYIEETVPTADIKEAVQNKKALKLLEQLRNILGVDAALSKTTIREAVVDGKRQINEASTKLEAANKELEETKIKLAKLEAEYVLERKSANLNPRQRDYLKKIMVNKPASFISENVDYAVSLFNKTEKERLQNIKDEAVNESAATNADRPVVEESTQVVEEQVMSPYLKELSKY
jgi:hypothetical protein